MGFCSRILSSYPVPPNGVDAASYIFGIFQVLSMPMIIYFIQRQASIARQMGKKMGQKLVTRADAMSAASNTIFPCFIWWLKTIAFANLFGGVANLFLPLGSFFDSSSGRATAWAIFIYPLAGAFDHFSLEGLGFLLCQRGVGDIGQRRAVRAGLVSALITFSLLVPTIALTGTASYACWLAWETYLLVIYLGVWILPRTCFFRRPAAITLARFWVFLRVINILSLSLAMAGNDFGYCCYFVSESIGFGMMKNFVIYYCLLVDSKWWQGTLGDFTARRGTNLQDPLLGIDLKLDIAQQLARNVDSMENAISLNSNMCSGNNGGGVDIINFAYLSLDKSKLLGVGGTSKVYCGSYKGEKVAVKLLFVIDITKDLIHRVVAEAKLLSRFKSCANVIKCHGVVVLPPCVAIILELCARGSLYDVIQAGDEKLDGRPWDWKNRIMFCLGAARGILTLHSKGICHRDLKSMNFLVCHDFTVKVTDLDLADAYGDAEVEHLDCLNWVPPETLEGEPYLMHGDVYALAMVFVEIVTGNVPFSEIRDPMEVRQQVLSGKRPELPRDTPKILKDLMRKMWDRRTHLRPSAEDVVKQLESLMEQKFEISTSSFVIVDKESKSMNETSKSNCENEIGERENESSKLELSSVAEAEMKTQGDQKDQTKRTVKHDAICEQPYAALPDDEN